MVAEGRVAAAAKIDPSHSPGCVNVHAYSYASSAGFPCLTVVPTHTRRHPMLYDAVQRGGTPTPKVPIPVGNAGPHLLHGFLGATH